MHKAKVSLLKFLTEINLKWYMQINIFPYRLIFKRPAGTSRGVYHVRDVHYLHITSELHPGVVGIGECAPLPKLSCDDIADYEAVLRRECSAVEEAGRIDLERLRRYPSMLFGLETALRHLERGGYDLYDTPFSRGEAGLPINGLVWMGSYDDMLRQVEQKMEAGFRCIKLKIGAIDFDHELSLIRHIRSHFSSREIEIRVDANGAFSPADALSKLQRLAELDLHSIEQPIRAGQRAEMRRLTDVSPLQIAFDEELIGINTPEQKRLLLEETRPAYIVLKPSLHGGIAGCTEWISEAERLGIGWWVTSALESNIGLNSIAQWCATLGTTMPQGLGTGALFTNNIEMPLRVKGDCLWNLQ
jgi:o-succinylbenzoate synthase